MITIEKITDLELPELALYTHLNENQLRHFYEPAPGLFIGESRTVIERALQAGYEPVSVLIETRFLETEGAEILRCCEEKAEMIPVYTADLDVLIRLTGYHLTRGILCAFRRKALPAPETICRNARRIAVLENIENPTNIGAIIRSAAALNMDAVLLTPACADPLYRRAIRVSVGTVFQVPWTYIGTATEQKGNEQGEVPDRRQDDMEIQRDIPDWPEKGMDCLHRMGFCTAALALQHDTVAIDDPGLLAEEKLALVLGNEGDGLTRETIAACDYTVKIPMSHGVDSLNVAAASAVAFWQLGRNEGNNI